MISALKTRVEPEASIGHEAKAAPGAARAAHASAVLGWSALALVLVVGVPIFLCMPLGLDVIHYDICARTLLRGGAHYRDTFDNNFPGIIWLHAGIRRLVGWRPEMLHAVDLLFFSLTIGLLLRWVRSGARVWTAAALYAYFLFLPETCLCQRDFWMLLLAVVGLTLRQRQITRLTLPSSFMPSVTAWAVLEGLCWGAAVWIKPFVAAPALACWLACLFQVRRAKAGKVLPLIADATALLAGGALAGALGLFWLWRSGSWPYFWDILLVWDRDYGIIASRLDVKYGDWFLFMVLFVPWSLVPWPAAYLAVAAIRRARAAGPSADRAARPSGSDHLLLAVFFLAWLFQALVLQFPHEYVLAATVVPAVVLIAVLYRWRRLSPLWATARMCLLAMMTLLWTMAFQFDRIALWARCCREGATPQVRSRLVMRKESPRAIDAAALAGVEDFLVRQGAGDGDVTCYSGATIQLYLDLNLTPPSRFTQIEMTYLFFAKHRDVVLAELNAGHARFVVSDLVWAGLTAEESRETDADDPLALPSKFPEKFALMYPWREPIVFRSGRYLVHRVTGPADHSWRDDDEESELEKPADRYSKFFVGNQSFQDEEQARASVAVIDDLYRRSAAADDRTGQHVALGKALTMRDRARAADKGREAAVFGRWLQGRLEESPTGEAGARSARR